MEWVERYKPNRWAIMRVSGRAMHRFALMFTLLRITADKKERYSREHSVIVAHVKRIRNLWFYRVKELVTGGLWLPGTDITRAATTLTVRRCLFCRPTCVFFRNGNQNCRPCNRTKLCPFCWARVAAYTYWNVRRYLNTRRKTSDTDIVACAVHTTYVLATNFDAVHGFCPNAMPTNIKAVKTAIAAWRQAYDKKAKALQRHTTGSMWSLVVFPYKTGWRIESRQFAVMPAGKTFPVVTIPGAEQKYSQTTKLGRHVRTSKLLGRFVRYPKTLLTDYVELTAVALQAAADEKLRRGTGRFRTCGSSLRTAFKREQNAKRQTRPSEERQQQ